MVLKGRSRRKRGVRCRLGGLGRAVKEVRLMFVFLRFVNVGGTDDPLEDRPWSQEPGFVVPGEVVVGYEVAQEAV